MKKKIMDSKHPDFFYSPLILYMVMKGGETFQQKIKHFHGRLFIFKGCSNLYFCH